MNALYCLRPRYEYTAKKELKRAKKSGEVDPEKIKKLQEAVKEEQAQNENEAAAYAGKAVRYGQVVEVSVLTEEN